MRESIIVRIIFGWLLDEGRRFLPFSTWTTILAAAHDAKQARIIYKGVFGDLRGIDDLEGDPRLTEHFGITVGGLTLDTVTGQPGSARGLGAGAIAWDEMLTQRDWDMWRPSARRNQRSAARSCCLRALPAWPIASSCVRSMTGSCGSPVVTTSPTRRSTGHGGSPKTPTRRPGLGADKAG